MSGNDAHISAPTRAILKALRHSKKYVSFYLCLTSHLDRSAQTRWIAHLIHPSINIQRVFFAGVPEAVLDAEDENEEEPAECVPTSCLT